MTKIQRSPEPLNTNRAENALKDSQRETVVGDPNDAGSTQPVHRVEASVGRELLDRSMTGRVKDVAMSPQAKPETTLSEFEDPIDLALHSPCAEA